MSRYSRVGLLGALILFSTIILAACGPDSASGTPAPANTTPATTATGSGAEIRIGTMGPLTGASSTYGTAIMRGFEMALEDFNAAGGIPGRKITFIPRDDKADPETGVININDLIDKEKVLAVAGTANTPVSARQAAIINQSKVVWMIPIATGTVITQDTTATPGYIFRDTMVDAEQAAFAVNYAMDTMKAKKIAVINDDDNYGMLGKVDILKALDTKGVKPVLDPLTYKVGDTSDNFKPMVRQLKQAAPDVIINWGMGAEAANIRKAMKELGVDIPMIGSWSLSQPNFLQLAGDLTNGILVPQTISVDTSNPKQQAFFDRYRKKYNTQDVGFPSGLAQSYDVMSMLLMALKQPGAADSRDKLRDAVENTGAYEGILKPYENPFKNQFHEALTRKDFIMTVWKDGKLVKATP